MIQGLDRLLNSRLWVALSLACALFALYEAAAKIVAGDDIEGALDLVLFFVLLVNAINRVKIIGGYVRRLRGTRAP
ncbi:MAG TPA: hypothetical protein VN832_09750 [Stellaceae bacterium]|nr:hypothetical protein [Stellaceae bacterium]